MSASLPVQDHTHHTLISKWCRLGTEFTQEEIYIEREGVGASRGPDLECHKYRFPALVPGSSSYHPSAAIGIVEQANDNLGLIRVPLRGFGDHEPVSQKGDSREAGHDLHVPVGIRLPPLVRRRRALIEDNVREWHEAHCRDYKLFHLPISLSYSTN